MKRALMVVGVVVVCLPMMFTAWLLLAAEWPRMDASTRRLPEGLRGMVAEAMMSVSSQPNSARRATNIDAEAVEEWRREKRTAEQLSSGSTPPELQALYASQVASKRSAKALSKRAEEQEKAGKACDAEESYTQAAAADNSNEVYSYAEGVGRAGLRCGDLPGARAGLEAAVLKEKLFIKGTDEDQLSDVRNDLLKDREFLAVVYERQHEGKLAEEACSDAHPGWSGCACAVVKGGDVECREKR